MVRLMQLYEMENKHRRPSQVEAKNLNHISHIKPIQYRQTRILSDLCRGRCSMWKYFEADFLSLWILDNAWGGTGGANGGLFDRGVIWPVGSASDFLEKKRDLFPLRDMLVPYSPDVLRLISRIGMIHADEKDLLVSTCINGGQNGWYISGEVNNRRNRT